MSAANDLPGGSVMKGLTDPCSAWFGDLNQADFDIAFFDRVLSRNPNYVQVLRCLGELLSRKGLHRRAVEIDRRLIVLAPTDGITRYNLACSLAVLGDAPAALVELGRAFEHGYRDLGHMEVDPDLDNLRDLAGYKALVRRWAASKS